MIFFVMNMDIHSLIVLIWLVLNIFVERKRKKGATNMGVVFVPQRCHGAARRGGLGARAAAVPAWERRWR